MLRSSARALKRYGAFAGSAAIALFTVYVTKAAAKGGEENQPRAGAVASSSNASPIYGVTVPPRYRDWKLIAVAQLKTDKVDQLRAQVGNDEAIKAFKAGKVPFPDGAIIVAMHWNRVPSEDNNKVLAGPFPGAQSFVVGSAANFRVLVKDSKKYAATGGWGFADFKNGKPGDEALHKTCFPCYVSAKAHDYVFTRYAPTP
jgi:Cytochrome P460